MATTIPELLAPAGDDDALTAALQMGADAVYFGLAEGMNARARTKNFALDRLGETCDRIHRAGAKAYLTLNTLVFESELPAVVAMVAAAAEAGVDALIVQDPAVALIARAVAPTLHVHASTQMTISSAEAAQFAARLGAVRVVVPRELSLAEIEAFKRGTPLELEVFVHGALCVSWSGQCLTSEAWGGRSANRGQCAQSCRMPYELWVDGARAAQQDGAYLLSPLDLAGLPDVPRLAELGVHGLKIEGRQKDAQYVASAVAGYRAQLQRVADGEALPPAHVAAELTRMALGYSRGFSAGFLRGSDHQTLVEARFPKHRGVLLGVVAEIAPRGIRVVAEKRPSQPDRHTESITPQPGLGVGFDLGHPELPEPGGPLYAVEPTADGWWLRMQRDLDLRHLRPGHKVWATQDPKLARDAARTVQAGTPRGRLGVRLQVFGQVGEPLQTVWSALGPGGRGAEVTVASNMPLQAATGQPLGEAVLREKLGALGDTPFALVELLTDLQPSALPVSALKSVRRQAVAALEAAVLANAKHRANRQAGMELVHAASDAPRQPVSSAVDGAELVPLVRRDEQLDAVIELGCRQVALDWMDLVGLTRAVDKARAAGLRVGIATVRVQKPGEDGFDKRFARLQPDFVLVRHWGALEHFAALPAGAKPEIRGDFSLNVTNALTANLLFGLGADSLTAAHDLDETQLLQLLARVDPAKLEVVVHQHMATFHTEHCVYAHTLSNGGDFRTCGRPCEQHTVGLRDHVGLVHPVVVDVGCRNTVFNAQAQSAAALVPKLLQAGVRRLRAEFVSESGQQVAAVLRAYRDLIAGRATAAETLAQAGGHEQFGVTQGTLRILTAP